MKVNVKKLDSNAVLPTYSKHGDAGMDLTATSKSHDEHGNVVYGTSLAFEIPAGYVGLLFPRSSNTKKDLILGNSVGVIDSGYRGEVVFKFRELLPSERDIEFGARLPSITNQTVGRYKLRSNDIGTISLTHISKRRVGNILHRSQKEWLLP